MLVPGSHKCYSACPFERLSLPQLMFYCERREGGRRKETFTNFLPGTLCILNCLLGDNRAPHYGYNRQIPKHVICFHGLDSYVFYLRDLPLMLTQICCVWWSDKINGENIYASLQFRETILFTVCCCELNPLNNFLPRCTCSMDLSLLCK